MLSSLSDDFMFRLVAGGDYCSIECHLK
jgi:hypothetical protein